MIITLTLNPCIDYILQVPQILMEDTLRAQYAFFQPGGKGIHVSRVLKRLGVETIAWGFCGGDPGRWLQSYLDEEQVSHDFINTQGATRVNTILTEATTHKQLRVSAPGKPLQNQEEQILLDRFRNLPTSTRWITLGGSLPPGIASHCIQKLIEHAQEQGIYCILDADGEVLKAGIQGRPYLIKPNQFELERLLGKSVTSQPEMIACARELIHQGLVQVVVISLGKAGALLVSRDQAFHAKAPDVRVLSKVGAGDSMVAGMAKGLLEEASLQEVLRMGVAAGTATVLVPPDELCQAYQYQELLPQVCIEPIE